MRRSESQPVPLGRLAIAGTILAIASGSIRLDANLTSGGKRPDCNTNKIGMSLPDNSATLECHEEGWVRSLPDPLLSGNISDLPQGIDRNTLEFTGWVGEPKLNPETGKWERSARVTGTAGYGIVTIEVPAP